MPRTPVSIITGFLGAGKTTLLNRILREPAMAGALVIINEFGDIGLDHLLIAAPSENTVLLESGCICCTVRGDLTDTLRRVKRERAAGDLPPFDRVLIETTGLADPVPIMQTVVADEVIAPLFEMDGVITLVDAVNAMAQLDREPQAVKQVALADRLLLTKTDIAPDTAALGARLAQINAGASVTPAINGNVACAALFGACLNPQADAAALARWLPAPVASGYRVTHNDPNDHIQTHSVTLEEPVTRAAMSAWLTALASLRGAQLLRVKGILNVEGQPIAVHAVQTLIHEPQALERWPDGERRSRLVFITRDLSREAVESTLDLLRLSTRPSAAPGPVNPANYASFLAAMQKIR
ncbi:MAG: GTP-binding protein [Betaproteobacteria bacterium]|nr:GTP-binding protein [Betaproteobacteria bacterium]